MSNVLAGIGRGQMQVLPDRIVNRRANFSYYQKALADLKGIEFLLEPEGYFSNRWLSCITVNPKKSDGINREDVRMALEKENIEARPLWKPMHKQPIFKDYPCWVNGISEKLFEEGLCLPSGSNLSAADLQRVVFIIRSLWIK
jgi:dTDP-4-amino-4,6-dideoxygalactose transaminase